MDNDTLRKDEIEALSAIYGDDMLLEEEESHGFSVTLNHPEDSERTIKLEIRFSLDYPLQGPPYYTLSAPWMSRGLKASLTHELDTIYLDNQGESILYMWIEKAREYLDKEEAGDSVTNDTASNERNSNSPGEAKNFSHEPFGASLHGDKHSSSSGKADKPNEGPDDEDENDENYEYKYEEFDYRHYHHHHKDHGLAGDINLIHGEPIVDRRSVFQAHICQVDCVGQVDSALALLKENKKIANATHNIVAYRITGGGSGGCGGGGDSRGSSYHTMIQDCDDDGETHAGGRLLHLLQLLDVKNVLVVVSRWFGGVNLGADRFKLINNAARDLLAKCGYIEAVQEKSNPVTSSGRKKKSK